MRSSQSINLASGLILFLVSLSINDVFAANSGWSWSKIVAEVAKGVTITAIINAITQAIDTSQNSTKNCTSLKWRECTIQLSGQNSDIAAPNGYVVYGEPILKSTKIKIVNTPSSVGTMGYIETEEGKFYITQYSLELYSKGKRPNWIYIR